MRHTSSIAGLIAQMLCAASTSSIIAASSVGKRYMTRLLSSPIAANTSRETRKMRRICMGLPSVSASEIMRESATGRPAVESVRNTL